MNEQPELENTKWNLRMSEIKWMGDPRRFENHVESRLNDLGILITGSLGAFDSGWPGDKRSDCQTVEELAVRDLALRWMMRVANQSEGAVRKALWLEIEKELVELEKIAEGLWLKECT